MTPKTTSEAIAEGLATFEKTQQIADEVRRDAQHPAIVSLMAENERLRDDNNKLREMCERAFGLLNAADVMLDGWPEAREWTGEWFYFPRPKNPNQS